MSDLVHRLRRHRRLLSLTIDVLAWWVSFAIFAWLRFDVAADDVPWLHVTAVGVLTGVVYALLASAVRLHQGRARVGSLEEMLLLGSIVAVAGGLIFVANLIYVWVPRSVPAGATVLTLVIVAWGRAMWRRMQELDDERLRHEGSIHVLIVGAGEAGRELLGSMLRDPLQQYRPVGFIDDDPLKRHMRIRRVPVLGTTAQLSHLARSINVQTVVLALPSASADVIARLRTTAVEAGLSVKVLPASTQLLSDNVGIRDLRDINLTDVLGRHQLDTDIEAIASYLKGRRILVTGAGGSIGSELCRQIDRFGPSELILLDRDESALHSVQLSLRGHALLDTDDVVLCDIRDEEAVRAIFASRRPEVVFHAAALKHLPMLEQYPNEAVKTNVIGTRIVLDAADFIGVDRFVNISTDKAANPSSVLGYSKRVAEQLTASRAETAAGVFLSVRFGNVLGSRGSVLASFAKQIAAGGPITVTDPDVTRYFMTIEEACQLVIQAAAIGAPGEALVLDMGEPIRIVDVANQLIEQSGTPCAIAFTGLRPGEKLHEELFGDGEPSHSRRVHPMVSHVPVPTVTDEEIAALPVTGDKDLIRRSLAQLCMRPVPAAQRPYTPAT